MISEDKNTEIPNRAQKHRELISLVDEIFVLKSEMDKNQDKK